MPCATRIFVVVPFGGIGAAVVAEGFVVATVVTLAAVVEIVPLAAVVETVPSMVVVAVSESDRVDPPCSVSNWLINSFSLSTENTSISSALASDAGASNVLAATAEHLIILKVPAGSRSDLLGESRRA